MVNKFEEILVCRENVSVYARNKDGRVLFRFNNIIKSFGVFRSNRMTDEEKEFCIIMFDKLVPKDVEGYDSKRQEMIDFMNYNVNFDAYCS